MIYFPHKKTEICFWPLSFLLREMLSRRGRESSKELILKFTTQGSLFRICRVSQLLSGAIGCFERFRMRTDEAEVVKVSRLAPLILQKDDFDTSVVRSSVRASREM